MPANTCALKRGITGGSRANPKRMQTGSDWSISPELLKQMSFSNNVEITLMEQDLTQRTDDVLAYFTIKSSDTQGSDSQSGQVDGKKCAYSIDWSL